MKVCLIFIIFFVFIEIIMIKFNVREIVFNSFFFKDDYEYWRLVSLVPIGLSMLTSYTGYVLAKKKNRNGKAWAILCFFINIWGIIILYFVPSQKNEPNIK